jgi:O-antigen/teichoic acid export membrane protein
MPSAHAALKWSFFGEIASKAVTPAVFVVLARLLSPEDYGVVAAATMVISFSQIFWEAGMGKAIIQYQGDRAAAANAAFWINNALGLFVAGVLVASSGLVADRIFHDPRVAPVLQVMALQVLLSASVSVHTALLQKDLSFQHLFWVRLATVGIPGLASIPLAWYDMGYWALVAGTLTGQVFQVAILWKTSPWRPRLAFEPKVVKELVRFGGWVAATALLAWFYTWADSFIVGIYLGPHELGLYRTGNALVIMIYGLLFNPLMPVLYSHLSAVSKDRARIRATMIRVIKILTFLSLPLAAIIAANADFIGDLVFGQKWQGVGLVITAMALTHGVSWVVCANGEAYRAVGEPSNETKIMALTLVFYLIGYLISIQQSFEAFIWTRFGLALAAISIHFWIMRRVLYINVGPVLRYVLTVSLICSMPVVLVSGFVTNNMAYGQALHIVVFIVFLANVLVLFERKDLVPQLYGIARKAIGR